MEHDKSTEIQLSNTEVIAPNFDKIPTLEEAEAKILKIHKLIDGLKKEGDVVQYTSTKNNTKQPFYTLPLSNKIWLALDFKIVSEDAKRIVEMLETDVHKSSITYNFRTHIKSPYGFEGVGFGACSSNEKGKGIWDEQQLSGMSQTRSQVRALRNALRISECSIEEMPSYEDLSGKDIKDIEEWEIKINNVYKDLENLFKKYNRPEKELDDILAKKGIDRENYCFETWDKMKKLYDEAEQRLKSKSEEQKKEEKGSDKPQFITVPQRNRFYKMMTEAGLDYESKEYRDHLRIFYNKCESINDISKEHYRTETDRLQKLIDDNKKQAGTQVNLGEKKYDDDLPF